MISCRQAASCGRNSAPTAYRPGAGNVKPSSADFFAKNLCGICTRMPAPSPARGSAPTAPRCSRLTRMVSASSTILCDLRPLMSAMNPTPQESFSSAGSNKPKPDALIEVLALPVRRLGTFLGPAPTQIPPAQVHVRLREGNSPNLGGNLRAASGLKAAFPPPSGAPSSAGGLTPRLPDDPARASWSTNWDSNAVLNQTWQIPRADTRA